LGGDLHDRDLDADLLQKARMDLMRRLPICAAALLCACPRSVPSDRPVLGADVSAAAPTKEPDPPPLLMHVREVVGVARNGEVIRSGVPIPRILEVRDPKKLVVIGPDNRPVPLEAKVLSRWNAARSSDAPIEWVLLSFPVSVKGEQSLDYRLITDGSAGATPEIARPLNVTKKGDLIVVDTGAAVFTIGSRPEVLFEDVRLVGAKAPLVNGGKLVAKVSGRETSPKTVRRIAIEHQGPLSAVIVVEAQYDHAPIGDGGLGSFTRYVFTAGSPTALVRKALSWEGALCDRGQLECGKVNAVLVERWRQRLELGLGSNRQVLVAADFNQTLKSQIGPKKTAFVRQKLRSDRSQPYAFVAELPGTLGQKGTQATAGILSVGDDHGAIAVALDHMHRYEPQALRLLEDGSIAIDLADDRAWLGARQGMFASFSVSALPADPSREIVNRQTWAPLNHPLRALPAAEWFAASRTIDVPAGKLKGDLAAYDQLLLDVLSKTFDYVNERGIAGLMTHGSFPRYWGSSQTSDEIDCEDRITPNERWDDLYWCPTWTDYHNTSLTAAIYAMRTGEPAWIDEITAPAALRMLHTQIFQCGPKDDLLYCGQAPAGYQGFRADFNSSHQYWDNLFTYYWLTGDESVVRTIERGARGMRAYVCAARKPDGGGRTCKADEPPPDEWGRFTGRVGMQWNAAYRFVGLAGDDPTFLEDWRSNLSRAVTRHYVEQSKDQKRYGFWTDDWQPIGPAAKPLTTGQLWMASLYDMKELTRWAIETGDAPLGDPMIPATRVLDAWSKTLTDFGSTSARGGDGTARGSWPNGLRLSWQAPRLGGELRLVEAVTEGDDPLLYGTGKACLSATLVQAGLRMRDDKVLEMGISITCQALRDAAREAAPLGKNMGLYLARLHGAVAAIAEAGLSCP
jgi:hypothetical protein